MTTGGHQYEVILEPSVRRALVRFPRDIQVRLIARMEMLAVNPRPPGVVKLAGHAAYRIRVGDYRIIYAILANRLVVLCPFREQHW